MKRQTSVLAFLIILLVTMLQMPAVAETEFEFYYQRIEEVIEINNPEPEGWWQHGKAMVKKVTNAAKKTWENAVTRNYFPGEGTKTWYSREDSNIAYRVNRSKVRSEEHLLELMGAENETELSNGQRALLEVFRESQSQSVQDRMPYSYRSSVKVMLSDTSGFDSSQKYPHVRRDFWPYSSGPLIQMSSNMYNWPGSGPSARSTFIHEFAHSMDTTIKEFIHPYGRDGRHYVNEMLGPRAAFVEGWAIYNEMLESESKARDVINTCKRVRIEDKKVAASYTTVLAEDLSGGELLRVEGIISTILYHMSNQIPDGRAKVFDAFVNTRWNVFRSLRTITRNFARNNPGDIAAMGRIIDEATYGKLSDAEMLTYLGDSAQAREFLQQRHRERTGETADESENPQLAEPARDAPSMRLPLQIQTGGASPFDVE